MTVENFYMGTLFANDSPVLLRKSPVSSEWEDKDYYVYWDGRAFFFKQ